MSFSLEAGSVRSRGLADFGFGGNLLLGSQTAASGHVFLAVSGESSREFLGSLMRALILA